MVLQVERVHHISGSSGKEEHHRDKCAEAKQNERDMKEAAKAKRQEQKALKHEGQHAEAQAFRMERAWNPVSKRAAKDAREERRHAEKHEEGVMCEHGIFKCRVCYPVHTQKEHVAKRSSSR